MKRINLEYTNISVLYPDIQWFLEKIERNEPFNFLRVNHGILDQIHLAYENNYKEFEEDYRSENFEKISTNIIKNSYKDLNETFYHYHNNSKKIKEIIILFLFILKKHKNFSDKLNISISLGVGLNTFWGVWNHNHPYQIGRTKIAHVINDNSDFDFYYSGVLKHYTIEESINTLFRLINSMNYKVIFLGPEYMSLYKNVFSIKNFKHIQIPQRGAINTIEASIYQIKKEIDKNTILFHSCGHILSSYLIYNLNRFDITTIDIGRSFDIYLNRYTLEYGIPMCWRGLDHYAMKDYVKQLKK